MRNFGLTAIVVALSVTFASPGAFALEAQLRIEDVVLEHASTPVLYPTAALEKRIGGQAVLSCEIQRNYALSNCRVTGEAPADEDFGLVAEAMAQQMRVSPKTTTGQPTAGRMVALPFGFQVTDGSPKVWIERSEAIAPSAISAGSRPRMVVESQDIEWLRPIRGGSLYDFYPRNALIGRVNGFGIASCVIADDGTLSDCRAVADYPRGFGFGAAAVSAITASKAKIGPTTKTGEATSGRRLGLSVNFNIPN
jgi:TonB family protein